MDNEINIKYSLYRSERYLMIKDKLEFLLYYGMIYPFYIWFLGLITSKNIELILRSYIIASIIGILVSFKGVYWLLNIALLDKQEFIVQVRNKKITYKFSCFLKTMSIDGAIDFKLIEGKYWLFRHYSKYLIIPKYILSRSDVEKINESIEEERSKRNYYF